MPEFNDNPGALVPVHVGIIMDGNGRWAQQRKLPRTFGHKEGLTVAKNIVRAAASMGIKYVIRSQLKIGKGHRKKSAIL